MRVIYTACLLVLCAAYARAACTGSVPNLSAPNTGNVSTNGSDLQSCINIAAAAANQPITITLTAGAKYQGNFVVPANSSGTNFITITSSASLPNRRITPADSGVLATVVTNVGDTIFAFQPDSHHWKLLGLEVTTTSNVFASNQLVTQMIGVGNAATFNHWPDSITIERCWVHPFETDPETFRAATTAIRLEGSNINVKWNYINDFTGFESTPDTLNSIISVTNANPAVMTLGSPIGDPGHKFLVYFQGATGGWAVLNGPKLASYMDSTHISLQNFTYTSNNYSLSNVNTSASGSFAGQSITWKADHIATSRCILIVTGPGPYTIEDNYLESYYTPIFTGGGSATVIDPQNQVTVNGVNSLTQVVLSSVGQLQVGDLIAFSAAQDQTISGATAGTTTTITTQANGYPAGTMLTPEGCITISGFTGTWTALNGNWGSGGNGCGSGQVTVIDSTHLSIPLNSTGLGAVTFSSPKWVLTTKPNSGPTQWQVGKVTGIAGTTVTYQWWGHQPENTNGNGAGIRVAVGAIAQFRGIVPHDINVFHNAIGTRRNWIKLFRDAAATCQNCTDRPPKALWEAKMGKDVHVYGNVCRIFGGEGLFDLYNGVTFGVNQANQDGATPWANVDNWLIENNLFDGYMYQKISLNEEYETGTSSQNFIFRNNLLRKAIGNFFNYEGSSGPLGIQVDHNTARNFIGGGGVFGGYSDFITAFRANVNPALKNSIGNMQLYALNILDPWTSPTILANYLIDDQSVNPGVPAGVTKLANDAAMGFVNVVSADNYGDYHGYALTNASIGHNAASDGTDVGVNFTTLDAALGGGGGPITVCRWNASPPCQ